MIDIKLIRENPDIVKENIKKKFQDEKIALVDEIKELDEKARILQTEGDELKANKNKLSKSIGVLMKDGKKDEAEQTKKEIADMSSRIAEIDEELPAIQEDIRKKMLVIPQIMDPSVPIGKDDSENVEVERFGEATEPKYEIPHHADICAKLNGLDKETSIEKMLEFLEENK